MIYNYTYNFQQYLTNVLLKIELKFLILINLIFI